MVRIYCLTSIFPLNEKRQDKLLQIGNYGMQSSFEDNTLAIFEKIKNAPEVFKCYQLTEINIGYDEQLLVGRKRPKRFFMCIYRNDTGWIRIRMLPGIVQFRMISNSVSEFLIVSSKLYPNDIEFDIQITVRCIRNTKTRGAITKDEEKCYRDYLERIKNISNASKEDAFTEIPFSLPNETYSKILKQRMYDISRFVNMVNDSEMNEEINVPENARFIQEIKCFSLRPQRAKYSQYQHFICQNSAAKDRSNNEKAIIVASEIDTSINAKESNNDKVSQSSVDDSPKNLSSRKRGPGRPPIFKSENERKKAKVESSKEYNERLKSQREDFKTEIIKTERKHQDLYLYVQNLKSKLASISFENGNNAKVHYLFQKWKELFKKNNENCNMSVPEDHSKNNAIESQNSSPTKNSAAPENQNVHDKSPRKLITRKEKQRILIRRLRERQKMEYQILQEKQNLLLSSIQLLAEISQLIEELLRITKSSAENFQINKTSNVPNIDSNSSTCLTTSATLNNGVVVPTRNINKIANNKTTNYEREVNDNSHIPVCIENFAFSTLIELTLQNCGITELSNFVTLPTTLSSLNLRNNKISYISSSISKMNNLKELNLANNQKLKEIPWKNLPSNLMRLNIQDTSITYIPSDIKSLNKLETFELGNEDLKYISWESISKSLQKISIIKGTNKLNNINLIDKCNLRFIELEKINLEKENSVDLIFKNPNIDRQKSFPSLQCLHLMNNKISAISWQILPSFLEVLKIEENSIDEIGDISNLHSLIRLEANFNSIKIISETITTLQALTVIQMENNAITFLPNGFENLFNLKYLNLKNNRFNYEHGNLEKSLWKRLPKNLSILNLNGNSLHKIPCLLKKLKLDYLAVNGCKLVYICPFFITKGRKNEFILEIRDNPMLQMLSIIPHIIFQPPLEKSKTTNLLPLAELNLMSDNKNFVNTSRFPRVQHKPLYKFEYCNDHEMDSSSCKCCFECGDITDAKIFEQLMVMDINLCLTLSHNSSSSSPSFLLQKSFDDENFMGYVHEIEDKNLPRKDFYYGPGKWKTMVNARLCPDCLDNFKVKTDAAFQDFEFKTAEKRKTEEMESLNHQPELITQNILTPLSFVEISSPYHQAEFIPNNHLRDGLREN